MERDGQGRLFAAISHEIKNSLNPVINLSGLMAKKTDASLSGENISWFRVIERNGRKIERVIDCFSAMNRIKNGEANYPESPLFLKDFADSFILSKFDSGGDLPFDYSGLIDKNLRFSLQGEILKRAIGCLADLLLSSGAKSLCFRSFQKKGSVYLFAVKDEADMPSAVFPEEERTEADRLGMTESSMMWWYFLDFFASYLGGGAECFYNEESGPYFSFFLRDRSEDAGPQEAESRQDEDEPAGAGKVMVVIDDDPDNMISIRAIIDHEFGGKYEIFHAESGAQGLDLLESVKPDIILLDINLPDMNGFTLVRNIKNFFAREQAAVIAFTGFELSSLKGRPGGSGFDDYIPKPFEIEDLIDKVRKWTK